jgi:hypothetical protein
MRRFAGQGTPVRNIVTGNECLQASGEKTIRTMNKYRIDLMDKNWKRFERRVAKRSGGRRISVADRETDLDVEHPYLGIECKYRDKISQYLKDWYKQAEDGSKNLQVPVVAIGEKNSSRIYALLDFDDLIMLLVHAVDDSDEALPTNYGGTD